MCNADKLIVMPEHATLAPPICRLAGEVLSIGRRVTQKGVVHGLLVGQERRVQLSLANVDTDNT